MQNPFIAWKPVTTAVEAKDLEPFSLVDEQEFTRRFQDVVQLADAQDEHDAALLHSTSISIVVFI